jgi:citrate lyase beta subunit
MLDLEDAVAPDDKEQSRANVIDALRDLEVEHDDIGAEIGGPFEHPNVAPGHSQL